MVVYIIKKAVIIENKYKIIHKDKKVNVANILMNQEAKFERFRDEVLSNFSEEFGSELLTRIDYLRHNHNSYLQDLLNSCDTPEDAAQEFIYDEARLQAKNILDRFTDDELIEQFAQKDSYLELSIWDKPFVVKIEGWNPDTDLSPKDLREDLYDFVEYSEVESGVHFEIVND
ncbi:MAG: hypothetical protein K6G11_08260 [Lachnospiraceae bacterium]|nr:hypothetical protein [Lachnospiraceae bacterium]